MAPELYVSQARLRMDIRGSVVLWPVTDTESYSCSGKVQNPSNKVGNGGGALSRHSSVEVRRPSAAVKQMTSAGETLLFHFPGSLSLSLLGVETWDDLRCIDLLEDPDQVLIYFASAGHEWTCKRAETQIWQANLSVRDTCGSIRTWPRS